MILTGFPMCNRYMHGIVMTEEPTDLNGSASVQVFNRGGIPVLKGKFQEAYPYSWPGRIYSEEVAEKLWANLKRKIEETQ